MGSRNDSGGVDSKVESVGEEGDEMGEDEDFGEVLSWCPLAAEAGVAAQSPGQSPGAAEGSGQRPQPDAE